MKRHFLAALCMAAILSAVPAYAGDTLKELFSRMAAAYGGEPPAAIVETGTTTSFRRGEGKLVRMYKAPDRFRIWIDYDTLSETRTMVGQEAWQQGTPANPVMRGAIALQVARIALPWNILDKQSSAVDLGEVAGQDGKRLRAVEFPLEDRLKLILDIDPESGRILRSRGMQTVGGSAMEFATVYADFRKAGRRIYAAREEHYAMGQHIGHSVIDKVEYPAAIPDDAFAP